MALARGASSPTTEALYGIHFENIGPASVNPLTGLPYPILATAPAQRITISDTLDADLNWSSFRLGGPSIEVAFERPPG
jgi:hypothetical protein